MGQAESQDLSLVLDLLRNRHDLHLAVVFAPAVEDDGELSRLAPDHRGRLVETGVLPARSGLLLYIQGGRSMTYARDRAVDEALPVALVTQQWRTAENVAWPGRVAAQLRGIYQALERGELPGPDPEPGQEAPAVELRVTSPEDDSVAPDRIVVSGTAPAGYPVRVNIRYTKQRFVDMSHDMPEQTVTADADGNWQTEPVAAAHNLFGRADSYGIRVELLQRDTQEVLSTVSLALKR